MIVFLLKKRALSRHSHQRMIPTRKEAWQLVCDYTESESLRRHMVAVEAAMRAYAIRFDENPDLWGVVGLLHDFDYERYPDVSAHGHPVRGAEILRKQGVDEVIIRAILAHGAPPRICPMSPIARAQCLRGASAPWCAVRRDCSEAKPAGARAPALDVAAEAR